MKAWATELGGYIVKNVCAGTPEEYLLKELWGVATPNERKVVASLIFKLVRCIAPLLIENLVLKERTGFLCKGRKVIRQDLTLPATLVTPLYESPEESRTGGRLQQWTRP